MKVAIINHPLSSPFAPPLSLPALYSYLRQYDIDVIQIDASIEAIHYYLSPENIAHHFTKSKEILKQGPSQIIIDTINERRIIHDMPISSALIDKTFKELVEIWSPEGFKFNREKYESELSVLNDALLLSSVQYFPNILSLGYYDPDLDMIVEENKNFFLNYYKNTLIHKLEAFQPDVIGISYGYFQQVFPGMALVRELRKCGIMTPIIAGGAYFSIICADVADDEMQTLPYSDVMPRLTSENIVAALVQPFGIRGEGEEPFLKLCQNLHDAESLKRVPNLVTKDEENMKLFFNRRTSPLKGKDLPALKLDGLPIKHKYISYLPVAPMLSSRGCYWNKCSFCDHATVIDDNYRELSLDTIIETLKTYKNEYGIGFAFFCDEVMSVSMLKNLSEELLKSDLQINFGTMARLEKGFLNLLETAAKAGCKFLSFGLESANPRIVSLMNKGYTHDIAREILHVCARNNIWTECHIIFGFPSEKPEEAMDTILFLRKNSNVISFIRVTPWMYNKSCKIGKNHEMYGLKPNSLEPISSDPRSYVITTGIQNAEAVEFVKKINNDSAYSTKCANIYFRSEEYFLSVKLSEMDATLTNPR
jgi:anaerobic magnesium-protoporphyrin IX monomethyl ester cyclase